jgi:signal peptidase II
MKEENSYIYLLIFSLLIFLDRITKIYVHGCNFLFCIVHSKNYGAAFGILQNATLFLIIVAALLLPAIFYFFLNTKSKLLKIALTLIAAGTVGNLIDRIVYKYVTDIISINFLSFNHFNLADLSNTIVAILLIIFLLKSKK